MKNVLREIGMIARCFESIANIEFKEIGLSKNQYMYLVRISEKPGIILEQLCDNLKVDRSTASRAVNKIVEHGLAYKVDQNNTGKKIQLYITEKGQDVYNVLEREEAYSINNAIKDFDQKEIEELFSFLERVRMNVEPEWEYVKNGNIRSY